MYKPVSLIASIVASIWLLCLLLLGGYGVQCTPIPSPVQPATFLVSAGICSNSNSTYTSCSLKGPVTLARGLPATLPAGYFEVLGNVDNISHADATGDGCEDAWTGLGASDPRNGTAPLPDLNLSSLSAVFLVPPTGSVALKGLYITGVLLPTSPYPLPAASFLALSAFKFSYSASARGTNATGAPPLHLSDLLLATSSCEALSIHQDFACRASPSPNFTVTPASLLIHRFTTPTASISNVTLICTGVPPPSPCLAASVASGNQLLSTLQAAQLTLASSAVPTAVGALVSPAYLYVCRDISLASTTDADAVASSVAGLTVVVAGSADGTTVLDLAHMADVITIGAQTSIQLHNLTIRNAPLGPPEQQPLSLMRAFLWTFAFKRMRFGPRVSRLLVRRCSVEVPREELALWFANMLGPESVPVELRDSFCAEGGNQLATSGNQTTLMPSGAAALIADISTASAQQVLDGVLLYAAEGGRNESCASQGGTGAGQGPCAADAATGGLPSQDLPILCLTRPEGGAAYTRSHLDASNRVSEWVHPGGLTVYGSTLWLLTGNVTHFALPTQPTLIPADFAPANLVAPVTLVGSYFQPLVLDVGWLPGAVLLRAQNASLTMRATVLVNLPAAGMFPLAPSGMPPGAVLHLLDGSKPPLTSAPPLAGQLAGQRRALRASAPLHGVEASAATSRGPAVVPPEPSGDHLTRADVLSGGNAQLQAHKRGTVRRLQQSRASQGSAAAAWMQGPPPSLANFTSCLWFLDFDRPGAAAAAAATAVASGPSGGSNGDRPAGLPYAFLDSVVMVIPQRELDWLAALWAASVSAAAIRSTVTPPDLAEELAAMREGSALAAASAAALGEINVSAGGSSGSSSSSSGAASGAGVTVLVFEELSWCGLLGRNVTLTSVMPAAASEMPAPQALDLPPPMRTPAPPDHSPPSQPPDWLPSPPASPGGAAPGEQGTQGPGQSSALQEPSVVSPPPSGPEKVPAQQTPVPAPAPGGAERQSLPPVSLQAPGRPSFTRSPLVIGGIAAGLTAGACVAVLATVFYIRRARSQPTEQQQGTKVGGNASGAGAVGPNGGVGTAKGAGLADACYACANAMHCKYCKDDGASDAGYRTTDSLGDGEDGGGVATPPVGSPPALPSACAGGGGDGVLEQRPVDSQSAPALPQLAIRLAPCPATSAQRGESECRSPMASTPRRADSTSRAAMQRAFMALHGQVYREQLRVTRQPSGPRSVNRMAAEDCGKAGLRPRSGTTYSTSLYTTLSTSGALSAVDEASVRLMPPPRVVGRVSSLVERHHKSGAVSASPTSCGAAAGHLLASTAPISDDDLRECSSYGAAAGYGGLPWPAAQWSPMPAGHDMGDLAAGVLAITGELGCGAQGVVYRGVWRGLPVAVKIMLLQQAFAQQAAADDTAWGPSDPRVRQAVMEAAISASVSHPNVVATYTYFLERLDGRESGAEDNGKDAKGGLDAGGDIGIVTAPASGDVGEDGPGGSRLLSASGHGGPEVWKLTLVQELCDAGSLHDCLQQGRLAACAAERVVNVRGQSKAPRSASSSSAAAAEWSFAAPQPVPQEPEPNHAFSWLAGTFVLSGDRAAPGAPAAAPQVPPLPAPAAGGLLTLPGPPEQPPQPAPYTRVMLLVALQAARGLAHLHSRAIVHADVSSSNILLKSDRHAANRGGGGGRDAAGFRPAEAEGSRAAESHRYGYVAKWCDFGQSGRLERAEDQTHLSGRIRRSSAYSAPELVRHGRASPAGDVYALAVVLWELALGLPLPAALARPEGGRLRSWLAAQAIAPPSTVEALPPGLLSWPAHAPRAYADLVSECLRADPAARPSAEQVCGCLEGMLLAVSVQGRVGQ